MQPLAATIVCFTIGLLTAAEVRGDWQRVADFSTASTCRDADGIALGDATGKLFAVKGNTLFQFGSAWRLDKARQIDQRVSPDFKGIESLPTGNLLLLSAKPSRLYEITPLGQTIATKDLDDRVSPCGVAYCSVRNRIYVLDGADRTVKQYSTADEPETVLQLGLADPRAVEVPRPGVFWVLDGEQQKIFSYVGGAERTELIDLTKLCDYQGPSGLALDRVRGILFICFAKSQRIVGVDVSGEANFRRVEPPIRGQTAHAAQQPYHVVQLPPQSLDQPPSAADAQLDSNVEVLPAPNGEIDAKAIATAPAGIQIPSPYPASTIVVKPPHPPTIYVLPIIVRGGSVDPAPGGSGAASPNWPAPNWPAPNYAYADAHCTAGEPLRHPPDLSISDLEVISVTGGRVTFRYLVRNASASPANLDGVIARAVVSADAIQNHGDKLVGYKAFHGQWLGPWQSRYVTGSGAVQQGFSGRPFLIVKLDTADRLAESNEENNATVTLITLAR